MIEEHLFWREWFKTSGFLIHSNVCLVGSVNLNGIILNNGELPKSGRKFEFVQNERVNSLVFVQVIITVRHIAKNEG